MRKRIRFGVLGGWILLLLSASADRPAPEGWGEIFARFDSYGLPDVSTAAYVKVRACWEPRVDDLLPDDWETSGNAWMLAETRDAKGRPVRARVVVDGSRTFEVVSGQDVTGMPEEKPVALAAPIPPKEILASGCWQEGNPARDAKKGIEFLKSLKWEGEPYGHYRYPGKLFLLAYGLWQRGDTTNAAALLAELAAREEGAEGVAREAMNLVADGEYGNLHKAFRRDFDWMAYRDGIRLLLEKHPEGWYAAPVMNRLLEKVEERIIHPAPLPKSAETWSPDDARQAARMVDVRAWRGGADIYVKPPVLWIAPSGWRDLAPMPLDAELEIRVRGIEAVPFLLSLMEEDDVLTDADRLEVSKDGPYRSRFPPEKLEKFNMDAIRDSVIRKAYEGMDRPATRGEVARRLLRDLIPEWVIGGSSGRMSKEEFIRAVREFHEKHRAASEEELAVLALPGRYSFAFNKLAVEHLMEVARQKPVPELERFLADQSWLVSGASKSDLDSAQNNKAELLKTYTAIRREVTNLAKTTEDADEDSSVARMLTDGHYDRTVVAAKLQAMPLDEVLSVALDCAARTTNALQRGALALLVSGRLGSELDHGAIATNHAAEWKELIADDRVGYANKGAPFVSDEYLVLNERLFSASRGKTEPDDRYSWQSVDVAEQAVKRLFRTQGPRGRDWLRERVRQRLAGVPEERLPVFPNGGEPEEGVMASLHNPFMAVTNREMAAQLAVNLSPSEHIALPEMLRREPELNARLMEMVNRVESVQIDGDLGEWNRKLLAWEGQAPTAELIEELRCLAEERAAEGKTVSGKLVRRPDFDGYEVVIEASVPVPEYYERQNATQRISGYAGMVCGPGSYGAATWRTAPPPGEKNWWAVETSGPFEMREFQKAMEQFLGSALPASEEAFVIFQTQGEKQ